MSTRNRVDERAHRIYDFLVARLGAGFTLIELCRGLGIRPGSTTTAAIRRARDLATEAGQHFPPAVPANGQRYMVTQDPGDALDPTLHMGRIGQGVQVREQVGIDFMEREMRAMPADLKPIAAFYLKAQKTKQRAAAELQKAADDMVVDLVKLRRSQRDS